MKRAGASFESIGCSADVSWCQSDGSRKVLFESRLLIKWKKELHFSRSRLIYGRSLIKFGEISEQSTSSSILAFIFSSGSLSKSSSYV
jgi:hypothetical protein